MSDTEQFADRWLSGEPVYLGDLDSCQPTDALTQSPQPGRWRLLDYETDVVSGVMLLAGPETGAPEVTYPLKVSGWHAVSVGVFPHYGEGSEVLAQTQRR